MAKIQATPPPGVDLPVGGAYSTGGNPYPGGNIEVDEIMPLPDRSDGTSESATESKESVERQLS